MSALALVASSTDLGVKLPKLLYLGDVPIESTVYGAALLHRLLADYPRGDLVVLEANPWRSRLDRRLAAIRYGSFPLGNARLLNSRFHMLYGSWLIWRARSKWRCIDQWVRPFMPEAVVTVTHGYSWLAAAEYASRKGLPFHLLLHDDWPSRHSVLPLLRQSARHLLAHYYRGAASRLCISPAMAEVYQSEFQAPAKILYPCSAPDAELYTDPAEILCRKITHPVIGFGGTVAGRGMACALRTVAEALACFGGKLLIYGPLSRERSRMFGLDLPNIELKGLVSSAAMLGGFRDVASALVVPQSFLQSDRTQTVMSFPSKLADYTAAGLPLLIVAPQYSSLVQWAKDTQNIAEIVTCQQVSAVQHALKRIISSPQHRLHLARNALEVHQKYFLHARAWATLCGALNPARDEVSIRTTA